MESNSRPPYEWSNEKILHFLELYFLETPIWNPNDIRHKDRNEVFDAWKRLEEALGFQYTITELKKKRENLMSTYRKLQNKVRASRTLGEVFKPDWFAYETMARYLNDIYDNRSSKHCEEGEDSIGEFEESALSEEDIKDFEVPVNPEHVIVSNIEPMTITSGLKSRKKRKITLEENGADENSNSAKKPPPDSGAPDEISLFCELLGFKLRGLAEDFRETAMFEMNNLMYHLKMQQSQGLSSAGGAFSGVFGAPCPTHMPNFSYRVCPRFCGYNCSPATPLKNTPQNSRQ